MQGIVKPFLIATALLGSQTLSFAEEGSGQLEDGEILALDVEEIKRLRAEALGANDSPAMPTDEKSKNSYKHCALSDMVADVKRKRMLVEREFGESAGFGINTEGRLALIYRPGRNAKRSPCSRTKQDFSGPLVYLLR